MRFFLFFALMAAVLLHGLRAAWGQAPPLGAAVGFAPFTAVSEVKNAGPAIVNGNISTPAGASSGFLPGATNNNNALVASAYTRQAATGVRAAHGYFPARIPCATPLAIYTTAARRP